MANFDQAIDLVLKHEGGYVNDPKDPGGETKYGISKRSYPKVDIKNLSIAQAKNIYRRDFWNPLKGDDILSQQTANQALDIAVNMGTGVAKNFLRDFLISQGYLDKGTGWTKEDTTKINSQDPNSVNSYLLSRRKQRYNSIIQKRPSSKKFLKGWMARAEASAGQISSAGFPIALAVILGLVYLTTKYKG